MRLKVSPKEALKRLDNAIKTGYALHADSMDLDGLEIDSDFKNAPEYLWFIKVERMLTSIFLDFAPVFRFVRVKSSSNLYLPKRIFYPNQGQIEEKKPVEQGIDVLLGYYDEILKEIRSPLRYIPEKAEIWLYDICCKLEPETNESELCKYMFKFGYGEYQEIAEIHKHILGEKYEPRTKSAKTVQNALNGINTKTNDLFGFALLSVRKSVVALSIPYQYILGKD